MGTSSIFHGYADMVSAAELSSWLSRWLDTAGLERVEIAGHSLGGLELKEASPAHRFAHLLFGYSFSRRESRRHGGPVLWKAH